MAHKTQYLIGRKEGGKIVEKVVDQVDVSQVSSEEDGLLVHAVISRYSGEVLPEEILKATAEVLNFINALPPGMQVDIIGELNARSGAHYNFDPRNLWSLVKPALSGLRQKLQPRENEPEISVPTDGDTNPIEDFGLNERIRRIGVIEANNFLGFWIQFFRVASQKEAIDFPNLDLAIKSLAIRREQDQLKKTHT